MAHTFPYISLDIQLWYTDSQAIDTFCVKIWA